MKKLLKSEVCGSVSHEQCTGPTEITAQKKKKKEMPETQTQDRIISIQTLTKRERRAM